MVMGYKHIVGAIMTLQCECGGALELRKQNYTSKSAFETYECVACGQKGTYRFGDEREETTGCVTYG